MILNFDPQFSSVTKSLREVVYLKDKSKALKGHFNQTVGIIVRLGIILDEKFLSKFKQLQFIGTVTTGTDHIDEKYCQKKDIKIISLKREKSFLRTIPATSEHTWGLLLSLIRRIPWAFSSVCKGKWDRKDFFGHDLYNNCLGIIGFGRIGKRLSVYARAFGMKVIFYDVSKIKKNLKDIKQVSLKTLLKKSDIISINLPLEDFTRHFLKSEHFGLMKKSAILINTSRGAIINEDALLYALKYKQIAGAAIDVLEDEYKRGVISRKSPLIKYANKNRNLLITPHIAGSTYESMKKTEVFIVKKIERFLKKKVVKFKTRDE